MGTAQSNLSNQQAPSFASNNNKSSSSKVLEDPIFQTNKNQQEPYPTPTGHEYDVIDKIAAELPNVIDEQSRQQVEDYKQACDNGRGPMVACFATAEYISLFERRHRESADLYRNVCFRPSADKSPNSVLVDGTKAYPAGCYNLAKMLMTGKGGIQYNRAEAYQLFDRSCRGGHGGACYLQAQILCTRPNSLGPNIPHDPNKAMQLYQHTCDTGDSVSCFTLATMLLRGDRVTKTADNVSPQEARGHSPVVLRENEPDRRRESSQPDAYVIPRNPPRAEQLLLQACNSGAHVTSCHNLAVMYTHGDDGVPADPEKAELYKKKTHEQMHVFGGFR